MPLLEDTSSLRSRDHDMLCAPCGFEGDFVVLHTTPTPTANASYIVTLMREEWW